MAELLPVGIMGIKAALAEENKEANRGVAGFIADVLCHHVRIGGGNAAQEADACGRGACGGQYFCVGGNKQRR